jgi:glycogen debranching enzyme
MNTQELRSVRGLRFLVTDATGTINEPSWQGLYFKDTRHLRSYRLLIDGVLPEVLTARNVQFSTATSVMTNPRSARLPYNAISLTRTQSLDAGLNDTIVVTNSSADRLEFDIELQYGTDFADLFEIKHLYLEKGNRPIRRRTIRKTVSRKNRSVVFRYHRDTFKRITTILFNREGDIRANSAVFRIALEPQETWELFVAIRFSEVRDPATITSNDPFPEEAFDAAHLIPPLLESDWQDMILAYERSLYDLAGLRIQSKSSKGRYANIPAAGMPWFMAVFGRDSLITAYQTLLLGSDLPLGTTDLLASYQGKAVDPLREEEPGKILHEIRFGEVAHFKEWVQFPYYGTVDATPLFLILVSEVFRWTGDTDQAHECRDAVVKALDWIDRYADKDGDGFYEYGKMTPTGLDNQNWRDSWDSMVFRDGTHADGPIASADVQGYVYDAKLRIAELAREIWKDEPWAVRLEQEAAELKERFNDAFWVENGQFFALGLDRNKNQIDSLNSSLGHLLWSGIVNDDRIATVVKHLDGNDLYSGWGVRTIGKKNRAFNPIGYHLGTVWPHDNSLIAAGLYRAGYRSSALRIMEDMIAASSYFEYRLPEVFAGYDRSSTPFPVQYPTSSSPQAWAAGTPILFLRLLLGIEPDWRKKTITIDPFLPEGIEYLRLDGVSAFGKRFLIETTPKRSSLREVKHFRCMVCGAIVEEGHTHT